MQIIQVYHQYKSKIKKKKIKKNKKKKGKHFLKILKKVKLHQKPAAFEVKPLNTVKRKKKPQ